MPIQVVLQKQDFSPGEQVDGVVHIQTQSSGSANLTLIGCHEVEFKYNVVTHTGRGKHRKRHSTEHTAKENKEFIKDEFVLGSFAGGQYTIPFSFLVPQNTPLSFKYDLNGAKGITKYFLEATSPDGGNSIQNIHIAKKPDMSRNEPLPSDAVMPFKTCCYETGKLAIKAIFEKDKYYNGDTINISAEVTNDSGTPIKLGAACYLDLILRAGSKQKPQFLVTGCNQQYLDIPEKSQNLKVNFSFKLETKDTQCTTTTGDSISARYSLKLYTADSKMTGNNIPIEVFAKPPVQAIPQFNFNNWAPQVTNPVLFQLNYQNNQNQNLNVAPFEIQGGQQKI